MTEIPDRSLDFEEPEPPRYQAIEDAGPGGRHQIELFCHADNYLTALPSESSQQPHAEQSHFVLIHMNQIPVTSRRVGAESGRKLRHLNLPGNNYGIRRRLSSSK